MSLLGIEEGEPFLHSRGIQLASLAEDEPKSTRVVPGFPRFSSWILYVAWVTICVFILAIGLLLRFSNPSTSIIGVPVLNWSIFIDILIVAFLAGKLVAKGLLKLLEKSLSLDLALYLVQGVEGGVRIVVWAVAFEIAWLPLMSGIDESHDFTVFINKLVRVTIWVALARVLKNFAVRFVGGQVFNKGLYRQIKASIVTQRILFKLRSPRVETDSVPGFSQMKTLAEKVLTSGFDHLFDDDDGELLDDASIRQKVREVATQIYTNCVGAGQTRAITREDVSGIMDAEYLDDALAILDLEKHDSIKFEDLVRTVLAITRQRLRLSTMVKDQTQISGVLDQIVDFVFWGLVVFGALLYVGVDVYRLLVPIGSLFLALSFALGDTIKGVFESLVMVFLDTPFAVGDEIQVDNGPSMLVDRIRLTQTILFKIDGEAVYMPNAKLARSSIVNLSRSRDVMLRLELEVDFETPAAQIAAFRSRVRAWMATQEIFVPSSLLVEVSRFNNTTGSLVIATQVLVHAKASQRAVWFPARTALVLALQDAAIALDLPYTGPPRAVPIQITGHPMSMPERPSRSTLSPAG